MDGVDLAAQVSDLRGLGSQALAQSAGRRFTGRAAHRLPGGHDRANRRGNRRVVLRVPRQTTVCGSAPVIASRRTVSRKTPSRPASLAAVEEVRFLRGGRFGLPGARDEGRGQDADDCFQQVRRGPRHGRVVLLGGG